ncbi:phage antirepressor KilAC domain-containing protein [Oerskovia enterophila]
MSTLDLFNRDEQSPFDSIRVARADGTEFWDGRELQPLMGYSRWEDFQTAIERAKLAANNSGLSVEDNFRRVAKVSGKRGPAQANYELSRYAAYLTALNGDPSKPESAAAQSYFVIRTREAEVAPKAAALTGSELLAAAVLEAQSMIAVKDAQIAALEPKAELADNYLTASVGSRLVGEVAKILVMKEKELRAFLLSEKLIFVRHSPCGNVQYDHYAEFAPHFEARETVVNHTWGSCNHYTVRITARGIELIRKRLRDQKEAT